MPGWKAPLAAAVLLSSASALKLPIAVSDNAVQQPLIVHESFDAVAPPLLVSDDDTTASAASSAKKPLVDSEALQSKISSKRLLGHAKALYGIAQRGYTEYGHPTRVIGSGGHNGTLDYIYSIVSALGGGNPEEGKDGYYHVWNQTFPATTGNVYEWRLVLNDTVVDSRPMGLTPPTKSKQPVFAQLALVANDGCDAGDYPADVKGAIALIQRGTCPFGTKSELAGKAGAVAAVVYNTEDGPLSGTLGAPNPDQIATFGLSGEEGQPLAAALKTGASYDGIAYIDSEVRTIITKNILAQTVGGDPDHCVMLGGHSDSVAEGPGINDDGSGSLTLIEVAAQLSHFSVNNCVRFAWWAAEEEGLLGSDYYAASLSPEENLKVRLFMDYDMLASPNYAYQVYNALDSENPAGSQALRDLYADWYAAHGLNYTLIPFDGRSDYDGFIRAGIPAGGIATGAEGVKTEEEAALFGGTAGDWYDPCYHQLCDDVSNVNLTAWELNSQLVAHSVATYAISFDGFPKRTLDDVAAASTTYSSKVRYHGGKLVL
ncbi:aminopeptidase Y [Sporothrix schenckii 1099-18]|uniref:Peptide hydrolase n=1 Tax=Sporothrix schenckii 1099-18 TaxID=1397361 RepID=A0A0F2MF11_SPOSC|nr:aminopeptidase Y [Sporothrix schenckii 1099-18]KJR88283.1 aminopeptidase Y [Sporothrix schenckii 1099-18]